jgi:hypothetical protein
MGSSEHGIIFFNRLSDLNTIECNLDFQRSIQIQYEKIFF